jgi:23S rRNA (uracil747-C5)-methyltransferase
LIPYQISSRTGELKGLILFYSPESDQFYLRFILRSKECVSRIKKLLPSLQVRFPRLLCVTANIQPIPHAILEGPEEIFITEQKQIDHRLGHFTFKLSPQAFVQTNVEVAARLYQTAADWISEMKPQSMLELFCGQGAFSFFASGNVPKITGIEINLDAVNTANANAEQLGLTHLSVQQQDATIPLKLNAELILVNPPRRGLGAAVKLIQQKLPRNFIYSSCSAETLGKDLKALSSQYSIKKAGIFDMFPHTEHFETLVWLELST